MIHPQCWPRALHQQNRVLKDGGGNTGDGSDQLTDMGGKSRHVGLHQLKV